MNRMKRWLAGLLLIWGAWGFAQNTYSWQYGGYGLQLGGGYGTAGVEAFWPFKLLGASTAITVGLGYEKAIANFHNVNLLLGGRLYFFGDLLYLSGKLGPTLAFSTSQVGIGGRGSVALGLGSPPMATYELGMQSHFTMVGGEFRIKFDLLLGYMLLAGGFDDD
jgi:hypothetical protein